MIAARVLPPLAVIAAIVLPAALLRPSRVQVVEPEPEPEPEPDIVLVAPTTPEPMTPREREVEACFLEWDERAGGDTDMLARIDIAPNGSVLVTTHGGPDYPALRTCVEDALLRTQYPIGHTLSLELFVQWTAKRLKISPNLIEPRRPVSRAELERKLEELKLERDRIEQQLAAQRARAH